MHQAAYLLALFALLSQLLALVRDRLLAGSFGAGHSLDLYYAAFRIPDLLFATVASLLSLYALLPILAELEQQQEGSTTAFLRQSLVLFFAAMGVLALALFILAPILVPLVAPGVSNPALVDLTRILLLQPILLGASNIVAALTQLRHRFLLYSISPLLYNLGIIVGIVVFYPQLGLPGLAWGVVLGACLHLAVQLPFFAAERAPKVAWRVTGARLAQVLRLSVPRTAALAAGQVSLLVLTALASLLSQGSIAVFMFAWNLQAVPLAIIGVSYSVAAFPTLARLHAAGEREQFVSHIGAALRHMLFWAIPATVLIVVLRAQLVRAILGTGAFDWGATRLVAAALALFIVSLCAQSVTLLIARAYYAAGASKKPLQFAAVSVATTIAAALLLSSGFHASPLWRNFLESLLRVSDTTGTTVLMLALGFTIGSVAGAAIGLRSFMRDFGLATGPLWRLAFQSFGASIIGGLAAYGMLTLLPTIINTETTLGILLWGGLAGTAGLLVTALTLALLRNEELIEAVASARRRFGPPPALEPTDVSS